MSQRQDRPGVIRLISLIQLFVKCAVILRANKEMIQALENLECIKT